MAFIKSIDINQFRGINSLEVSDFSNINLLVGITIVEKHLFRSYSVAVY